MMPDAKMSEDVRLLIAQICLIVAIGGFGDNDCPMRFLVEHELIEQICTRAFAKPNDYIRRLIRWTCGVHWFMLNLDGSTPLDNARYFNDKYIAMVALKTMDRFSLFEALKEASNDVKFDIDREVVLAALKISVDVMEFVNKDLLQDRVFMLTAINQNVGALEYATEELRGDREIVLTEVTKWGDALEYASEELRGDREIVMTAVQNYGPALQYATRELRGDQDIVMTAVKDDGWSLRYAVPELWDCPYIFEKAALNIYDFSKNETLEHYKERLREQFVIYD